MTIEVKFQKSASAFQIYDGLTKQYLIFANYVITLIKFENAFVIKKQRAISDPAP